VSSERQEIPALQSTVSTGQIIIWPEIVDPAQSPGQSSRTATKWCGQFGQSSQSGQYGQFAQSGQFAQFGQSSQCGQFG